MTNQNEKISPDITFIVPVYNADNHIRRLAKSLLEVENFGIKCQLIFIDDGSKDRSLEIVTKVASEHDDTIIIYNKINTGAGLARNLGWEKATGRYTIFFDADDIFHHEPVVSAIHDLDKSTEVDVAVFGYCYERNSTSGFTDMGQDDRSIFDNILKTKSITSGPLSSMPRLLTFTNYPWNKIIRTAYYKRVGLRFGSTMVNNDILGHWNTLLFAREIMIRDDVNCTHIVHPGGSNITNNMSKERLEMFDALEETYDLLELNDQLRQEYSWCFWFLADRLASWGRSRISPNFSAQYDQKYTNLLLKINLDDFSRMKARNCPQVANRIVSQLISQGGSKQCLNFQ